MAVSCRGKWCGVTGSQFIDFLIAGLGSVGLWQLVMYLINRRANQRKAEAEANVQEAAAAVAFVGIEKAEIENERALVAGVGELTQHALNLLEVYRKDNEAMRGEGEKMAALNRELLERDTETRRTLEMLQVKVASMELVMVDMSTGLSTLSHQLEEAGVTPAWKPTLVLERMESALTPEVFKAVRELFNK